MDTLIKNETAARREERRVHYALGGTQATQQRSCSFIFNEPIVGVLALQGCVLPHKFHIEALGAKYKEVRTASELQSIDALILPGGESTTMLKLIKEFELEPHLIETFKRIPIWGICAGAILIAKKVSAPHQHSFGLLDIEIERNAYGSQLNSFNTMIENSPVSFIRAPIIRNVGAQVQVKAKYQNEPVWVQQNNFMATSFHPELETNRPSDIHKYFIHLASKSINC